MGRQVVRGRPAKTIDFKSWSGIPGSGLSITAAGTFTTPGSLAFGIPGTILRIRGSLVLTFLASGFTANDEAKVTFGLGLFSTDAVALGATALPDPNAEADFPWLWYGTAEMISPSGDLTAPGSQVVLDVDTKAMRKFKPGQSLQMVGEYVDRGGLPGLRISSSVMRTLIGT